MIKSISLKNIATYSYQEVQINNLKEVNFIYGANGIGKTTLSNFLLGDENDREEFKDCLLEWKNDTPIKTLVYNKRFKEQNFGQGKLKGIFTLGQATTEQIAEIHDKKIKLERLGKEEERKKETLKKLNDDLENLQNEFIDKCWEELKLKYENDFRKAFDGVIKSKERFKDKLLEEFQNNSKSLSTYEELKEKAKIIFGETPMSISEINNISFDEVLQIQNDVIWRTKIIGKSDIDIANLIIKLGITDWVNEGKKYIQDNEDICPFCQKNTINDDFRNKLELFFDETYTNNINYLKDFQQKYNSLMDNIINELNMIENDQKNIVDTKLNIDKYSSYLKTLISQNNENKIKIESKIKEPSREIELISLKEQLELLQEQISFANTKIQQHNIIVTNFQKEKGDLINSVWKFLVDEFRINIQNFNKSKNGKEKGIQNISKELENKEQECNTLRSEIQELNKNITSIQPTVDEINRLLKSFGFSNFKIVSSLQKYGFYEIQRENGEIAEKTLSEGEITFITFLYYYHKVKGGDVAEEVSEDRILVIDDPISSLDSNILFIVSTLIKDLIREMKKKDYVGVIKQIILLTHNIYFHKEVSFIDKGRESDKLNYWILRKNDNITNIQAYGNKNPIKSSYAMLWKELQNENNTSSLMIQNIMRRILENYFKVLGNYKNEEEIIEKFPSIEEKQICRSLYYWINDGSHCFSDALEIDDQNITIETYKKVFKDIFTYTGQEGHYKMMMSDNIDENFS